MWTRKGFCSFMILLYNYVDVGCNGHVQQDKAPQNGDWQVGKAFLLGLHSRDSMLMQFADMHNMAAAVHTLSLTRMGLLPPVTWLSKMIVN